MVRTVFYFLIFSLFIAQITAAKPPGGAGPKEPEPPVQVIREPDEPLLPDEYFMETHMDDLKFKEPEEPPVPESRPGNSEEKEPEPLPMEPSPRGIISECPPGLVCR